MDYLKLLNGLKNEFFAANKATYNSINVVARFLLTIIFIPLRISFFFARLFYWFTWFFFKCLATPVDYLQTWLNKQQDVILLELTALITVLLIQLIMTIL